MKFGEWGGKMERRCGKVLLFGTRDRPAYCVEVEGEDGEVRIE